MERVCKSRVSGTLGLGGCNSYARGSSISSLLLAIHIFIPDFLFFLFLLPSDIRSHLRYSKELVYRRWQVDHTWHEVIINQWFIAFIVIDQLFRWLILFIITQPIKEDIAVVSVIENCVIMKTSLFRFDAVKMRWLWLIDKDEVDNEFTVILVGLDHCQWHVINLLSNLTFLNFLWYGICITLLGVTLTKDEEGIWLVN